MAYDIILLSGYERKNMDNICTQISQIAKKFGSKKWDDFKLA
jgi:ribosomal protein S10